MFCCCWFLVHLCVCVCTCLPFCCFFLRIIFLLFLLYLNCLDNYLTSKLSCVQSHLSFILPFFLSHYSCHFRHQSEIWSYNLQHVLWYNYNQMTRTKSNNNKSMSDEVLVEAGRIIFSWSRIFSSRKTGLSWRFPNSLSLGIHLSANRKYLQSLSLCTP